VRIILSSSLTLAVLASSAHASSLAGEPQRMFAAGAVVFAYVCFCALLLLRHEARRPPRRARRSSAD
jgi:hypothetical protein